ncbi:MAG: hypothetical protein JOZ41_14625 [Chloroflexi bacterium]|nr:hypothetical protein [Chloroflexota bacterium]
MVPRTDDTPTVDQGKEPREPKGQPSNPVYARVGDTIKLAAHDGVRRGLTPQDIIREIAAEHHVHLNVAELRLLLAGRRLPE